MIDINIDTIKDKSIDEFLFTDKPWKTNPVTTIIRRIREHLDNYPEGSSSLSSDPF